MIVDAFAGCGGWDEGARTAGWTGPLLGVDHDMPACRTAVAAGHARVCADVATFPLTHLADKVTGLIASPPCPSWSTAGTGAGKADMANVCRLIANFATGRTPGDYRWEDDRSALTAQPMRWAVELRGRWIALEQVPAVLPLWRYIASLLRELGYRTWCGILGAECYGVAQTRRRAILMASLDGPVGRPTPTHQPYRSGCDAQTEPDLFGEPLPPPVSMAKALGWDGATQFHPRGTGMTARHGERPDRDMAAPSMTITAGERGSDVRLEWRPALRNGTQDNACTRELDEPAGTIFFGQRGNAVDWVMKARTGASAKAASRTPDQPAGTIICSRSGNLQWVRTRPATTVCGDARIAPPGHRDREGGEPQFGPDTVRVTVQEAGILQSFPRDYPWAGTKTQQYRCVGDGVPPLLAAAVLRPLLATTINADSRRTS